LGFVTTLLGVVAAVRHTIRVCVAFVAAAVHAEVRRKRNSAAEEEDGVEYVDEEHDHRVESEVFLDGGREQVEERKHREGRDEHGVVDDGWISSVGFGNHVTDKRHDQ